jgi:tRNA(adenine34) deaminase
MKSKPTSQLDQKLIRRCIELSQKSVDQGDAPFGALIADRKGKILVESSNNAHQRISDHAEILVLHAAHQKLGSSDLSEYTLYSNCEPCPMCSFMAREYKIQRVVFSVVSPFVGGYTKWPVLQDQEISQFKAFFGEPPEIIGGVLESEAKKVLDQTPLWMFGSDLLEKTPRSHSPQE